MPCRQGTPQAPDRPGDPTSPASPPSAGALADTLAGPIVPSSRVDGGIDLAAVAGDLDNLRSRLSDLVDALDLRAHGAFRAVSTLPPHVVMAWNHDTWNAEPPRSTWDRETELVRVGELEYALDVFGAGTPPRLFSLPALVPLLGAGNLLLAHDGAGGEAVADLLQSIALRLIATRRPGRLEVELIDPVSVGVRFRWLLAALADSATSGPARAHDDVTGRMSDLADRLSEAAQRDAAGVSPGGNRLLVVVNGFPDGFTPQAAKPTMRPACSHTKRCPHDEAIRSPHRFSRTLTERPSSRWSGRRSR